MASVPHSSFSGANNVLLSFPLFPNQLLTCKMALLLVIRPWSRLKFATMLLLSPMPLYRLANMFTFKTKFPKNGLVVASLFLNVMMACLFK
jgi:hypothetical protein